MPHIKYRSPSIAPAYTGRLSTDPIPSLRLPVDAAACAAFVHARAANASAADPGPVSVPTSASRILSHIRHAIAHL